MTALPHSVQSPTLNSWKEIAIYFNRGVRTVQRWESELGLPVHRLGSGPRSPVFAYPPELESWVQQQALRNDHNRTSSDISSMEPASVSLTRRVFEIPAVSGAFQTKYSVCEFLLADLNAGLTLARICSRACIDFDRRSRTRANARNAYDFVLRFSRRIPLSSRDRLQLDSKLSQLRLALQELGEDFGAIGAPARKSTFESKLLAVTAGDSGENRSGLAAKMSVGVSER